MIVFARPRARMLPAAVFALVLLALPTAGCNVLSAFQKEEVTTAEKEELSGSLGPCQPWFDRGVVDVSMSKDGSRIAYIATRRPESHPEDTWRSGDRAVFVRDMGEDGSSTTRYIATTWPAIDTIPAYAPDDPNRTKPVKDIPLAEQIEAVALSDDGTKVAIGVTRESLPGGLSKLYVGDVPEDTTSTLSPDNGLTIVPINLGRAGEAISDFVLSPDGTKVAAAVGARGELRVYDLVANQPIVYTLGEENETVVENALPEAGTSIEVDRRAAVLTGGSDLHWSPDGARIAFARTIPVSRSYVQSLDVASGELTTLQSMVGVTTPSLAWASDGASLFVMTTELADSQSFGSTTIRRYAAEKDGDQIGAPLTIERKSWWRTEPNHLVSFGNDRQFLLALEGELMRIDFNEDGTGGSSLELPVGSGGTIPAQPVALSSAADRAVFLLRSGGTTHVGQRTFVGQYPCPEAPTAAPAQGEGEAPAATDEG